MRRRRDKSNSSRAPVMVSHRMIVKNPVNLHRAEAALAVALPARRMVRR